jgi:hypothetical protein
MTQSSKGWWLFVGAVGLMLSMMAADVKSLESWQKAFEPDFVGQMFAHIGAVIAAFMGGKLIPTDPTDKE